MRNLFSLFFLLSTFTFINAQKIAGFADADATKQLDLEKQFDTRLSAKDQDEWMRFLSSHPHHVGSPQDKANAEYIANLFRSWGWQAEIESYWVLFPTPKTRVLELLGSEPYKAKLQEPALPEDRTSRQTSEQLASYNAYSADGDVTAQIVFVNRGVPADYEELERMGIDVKGKIVIAKYGGSWRGIKPKVAYEHGAIGCIIYSDPADDGYAQGDVYPAGPFRRADGVQRGSVMDMPVRPGDPLTPDYGATKIAKRLDLKDAETIMKIPVVPISYEDALPFLKALGGEPVPATWRGALPITYHVGPSKEKVHLKLESNWDQKQLYDVIARITGSELPDEWIIRGNHHDAWVNGAADPLSGLVAELSEAKAIGELQQAGYRPKRTLIYCAWDGEEPALIGSTEWTEDHQQELKQKAVAYINSDGNGRGFIGASGSHTLENFFNEIADNVVDPETGTSIKERHYAKSIADADANTRTKLLTDHDGTRIKLGALGAGSDYSPFLQHLGIASLNLGFGGEDPGGEYHSIFDSYDLFKRFKDPDFAYGVTLSKTAGRAVLRLADADILPFEFDAFYQTVLGYVSEVKTLLDDERAATDAQNKMVKGKLFDLASDPKKTSIPPKLTPDVPYLNFSSLDNALVRLKEESGEYQKLSGSLQLSIEDQHKLNAILYLAERSLMDPNGLPRRPWYKHVIYAPGYYTGYGVKTLPGIREAIEQKKWKEAQDNEEIVASIISRYSGQVQQAVQLANKPGEKKTFAPAP